jgi:hypothetical protein
VPALQERFLECGEKEIEYGKEIKRKKPTRWLAYQII